MRYEEVVPPPPHRIERGHIIKVETDRGGCEYEAAYKLPLDRYLAHKIISPRQHRAGRRYETLYVMSKHLHHHVQVRYSEFEPTNPGDFEAKFLISVEFLEASKALRGLIVRSVTEKVCLRHKHAGPANICYLREGLDYLADHFKSTRDGKSR